MPITINGSGTVTGISAGGLPDAIITQPELAANVAGNGPAFSVYRATSNQSISASTWTKIQFQTEEFDTNNNYDNATNYRFTPTVAGYYQINVSPFISYTSSGPTIIQSSIYKNGTIYKLLNLSIAGGNSPYGNVVNTVALVYMNGTTDYIEGYAWSNSASAAVVSGSDSSYMTGFLARAA
jgi:hypothetical protein